MVTYEIVKWAERYEISESRRHKKNKWLPLPNSMDTLGFKMISNLKEKHEVYCCWILMLQIASKMPTRGVLRDDSGPLTSADLSIMTGFPQKSFETALEILTHPKIGWIQRNGDAQSELGEHSGHATSTLHNRTLHNTTLQDINTPPTKKSKHLFKNSPIFDVETFAQTFPDWDTEKLTHYWESASDYSDSKGAMYKDWAAAVRSWERKDSKNGGYNGKGRFQQYQTAADKQAESIAIIEERANNKLALARELRERGDIGALPQGDVPQLQPPIPTQYDSLEGPGDIGEVGVDPNEAPPEPLQLGSRERQNLPERLRPRPGMEV